MSQVFQYDEGTQIKLDTKTDLTNAIVTKIKFAKPSGTSGSWSATVSEELIVHTTGSADLDELGFWVLQSYVEFPSWKGHGKKATIEVLRHV